MDGQSEGQRAAEGLILSHSFSLRQHLANNQGNADLSSCKLI